MWRQVTSKVTSKACNLVESTILPDQSKRGLCEWCSVKTHNVFLFRYTPLTNDNVDNGRCIQCNPKYKDQSNLMLVIQQLKSNEITKFEVCGSTDGKNAWNIRIRIANHWVSRHELFHVVGMKALLDAISCNTSIKEVVLRDINDKHQFLLVQKILDALRQVDSLESLTVVNVHINDKTGLGSLLIMMRNNKKLRRLCLKDNSIDSNDGQIDRIVNAIKERNKTMPSCPIDFLDLENNKLKDRDVKRICRLVENTNTKCVMKEINLRNNQIGDDGLACLCDSLSLVTFPGGVEKLNLSINRFGVRGLSSIERMLKANTNQTLKVLNVQGAPYFEPLTNGSPDWSRSMLNGIRNNTTLEELHGGMFSIEIRDQIKYYLTINKEGYKILRKSCVSIPLGIWASILSSCGKGCCGTTIWNKDLIYFFLRNKPDLVGYCGC